MSQDAQNNEASSNPYAPPRAELQHQSEIAAGFYIVGKTKFWLLFLVTVGIYGLYWFYRQWQVQKVQDRSSIRPIARAIFSIFYTVSLTTLIESKLRRENIAYEWAPNTVAGAYIFFTVLSYIASLLSG